MHLGFLDQICRRFCLPLFRRHNNSPLFKTVYLFLFSSNYVFDDFYFIVVMNYFILKSKSVDFFFLVYKFIRLSPWLMSLYLCMNLITLFGSVWSLAGVDWFKQHVNPSRIGYVYWLGNHIHCPFIFIFFLSLSLLMFFVTSCNFTSSYQISILPSRLGLYNIKTAPLQRDKTTPNEYPGYDTKQFDREIPVIHGLWGMQSSPSFLSLPSSLWSAAVEPDKALSMG